MLLNEEDFPDAESKPIFPGSQDPHKLRGGIATEGVKRRDHRRFIKMVLALNISLSQ